MTGIAVLPSDLPATLVAGLADRVHDREGRTEVQFHWWQEPALLPVRWEGAVRLLRWGCKSRRSRLPYGGYVARDQVATGLLAYAEEVVIPATIGFHKGTWFLIDEGVCGVVLPDGPVVYVLTVPSTNYYRNMTGQSPTMPVFVNQVI